MASLRKISGNYYARFYDASKKPKRKTVPLRVSLKSAAQKKMRRLEQEWAEGTFDPWAPASNSPKATSVQGAVKQFLKAKSHLRPRTRETYKELLDKWTKDLPPGVRLQDVSAEHIRPYVLNDSIKRASQRKRYRHLRVFLNWSVSQDLIQQSPLKEVRQPKKEKKAASFLSTDDFQKLLRCIEAHAEITEDAAGRSPDVQWLSDLIRVGVCTGLRRGELLRLRWADVDLSSRLITVRSRDGEKTKSGHERQLPLRSDALQVIQRLNSEREDDADGPVFTDRRGLPIKPGRATKRFKFFVKKAKLPDRESLSFHSLRHTCGSWLAMEGVPMRVIQAILGHSSISVTEIYSHLQPGMMGKALEKTFGE